MKIEKIIARDVAGNDISGNVKLDYSELNGATVCSVCVKAEDGLRGDEVYGRVVRVLSVLRLALRGDVFHRPLR